jgi:hypothetical protein
MFALVARARSMGYGFSPSARAISTTGPAKIMQTVSFIRTAESPAERSESLRRAKTGDFRLRSPL